jgi:hypothetical protein
MGRFVWANAEGSRAARSAKERKDLEAFMRACLRAERYVLREGKVYTAPAAGDQAAEPHLITDH